jgi:RimJ/RimL family protein N-acetyltransferase
MLTETERLILREFTFDDLDAFARLMADPEVMRFSLNGPMADKAQAKDYLQHRIIDHHAKYGYGLYAIVHKDKGCLIGIAGLLNQDIDGEHKVELGYRLHPDYWGQGYAFEAAKAICSFAFERLGLNDLISIIDPRNVRSVALARRIGMNFWKEAVFHDIHVHVYRLTP